MDVYALRTVLRAGARLRNASLRHSPRTRRLRTAASGASASLLIVAVAAGYSLRGAAQTAVRTLLTPASVEQPFPTGDPHIYGVALDAGECVELAFRKGPLALIVSVSGPDGQPIARVDASYGSSEAQTLLVVAEVSGVHRVEVRAVHGHQPAGLYEVSVGTVRQATSADRKRLIPERVFSEAAQFRERDDVDSLRKASEQFARASELWRDADDRVREADSLLALGQVRKDLGEGQAALDALNRALTLYEALDNRIGEAAALNTTGAVHDDRSEKKIALGFYDRALAIYRTIDVPGGHASVLNNIAVVWDDLGDKQKALSFYNQALPLHHLAGDLAGEGAVLNNIGLLYREIGENAQAFAYLNRALPLRRAAGDLGGEGSTLNNLALLHSSTGDRERALGYYGEAVTLFRKSGDRRGEGTALTNIGAVYLALGETDLALNYFEQGLPLRRAVGDRFGEAITIMFIGRVYGQRGELPKAREAYARAAAISRSAGYRLGEANAAQLTGDSYLRDDPARAITRYSEALPLQQAAGDVRAEASTLGSLGQAHAALGHASEARDYFQRGLALARRIDDRPRQAERLWNLAELDRDDDIDAARQSAEAALAVMESLRANVGSQQLRASYLASKRRGYELYTDILMRLHERRALDGFDAAALQVSERSRARSLLDMLASRPSVVRRAADQQLLAREDALRSKINAAAERQARLLARKSGDEEAAAVTKEMDLLVADYQRVRSALMAADPRYADLVEPHVPSLQEIQRDVLDDDTLLLEYFVGERSTVVWVVTRTTIDARMLPGRATIDALVRAVHAAVDARGRQSDDMRVALVRLSRTILQPVSHLLAKHRLAIVPDDALQYVPFAALTANATSTDLEDRPLIAAHEIVMLPSASVLAALRRQVAERASPPRLLALLADPVFQADDARVRGPRAGGLRSPAAEDAVAGSADLVRAIAPVRAADTSGYIPRLPFSRREATSIAALAPEGTSMTALDFRASKAVATGPDVRQHRIVHFATHAVLNTTHPELSGLVLSRVDRGGQTIDGVLRLHEIYGLDLPADLVVLSGCQTGLGKEIRGEGLVGLTRGFMYSGAARVVVSLWKVDDEATAELMNRFYRAMLRGRQAPAAALRTAQLAMARHRRWSSPLDWAAFVIQGEWRPTR